ncbi:MAG: hypothetical protein K0Q66_1310 [Chitinophagaceae bacterium]|jgi:hypothetical protein|nr:hypothetical protein [Chitinophagaceae bacterium]
MKQLMLLAAVLILVSCSSSEAEGQKPTKADVTKVIKATWEKSGEGYGPKETVEIHEIKFGASEKANAKQELEGVPKGALVTHAKIDFTLTKHYDDGDKKHRRVMSAWVYKDQFGDWKVKSYGSKDVK